jgi:uncharacterized protein YndB with AHSA1/START domain
MSRTTKVIDATPEQIFAVLSDGWNYADWVVGAVHIRAVDATWPSAGSQVHHNVGAWPVMIADATEVLACDPTSHLALKARMWPLGEARVELTWQPTPTGRTRVVMTEEFTGGPLLALRNKLNDVLLHQRNAEALCRLADLTRRYLSPVAPT